MLSSVGGILTPSWIYPSPRLDSEVGFPLESMEINRHFRKVILLLSLTWHESLSGGAHLSLLPMKVALGTNFNQTTFSSVPSRCELNSALEKH